MKVLAIALPAEALPDLERIFAEVPDINSSDDGPCAICGAAYACPLAALMAMAPVIDREANVREINGVAVYQN